MDTIIENQQRVKNESKKNRFILKKLTKKQRSALQTGGVGLLGMMAGTGIFSLFAFKPTAEPVGAEFEECGPEIENATDDGSGMAELPVIIYTEAPFAESVTDEMAFNEAFDSAREELGQGGFFEWRGSTYNTYTSDEWESLTPDQQQAFMTSVHENTNYSTVQDVADVALVDGTVIVLDGVAVGTDGQPFTGNYGGIEYQDGQSLWVDDSIIILDGVAVDASDQPFTGSYGGDEYVNGVLVENGNDPIVIVEEEGEEIVEREEILLDLNQDNIADAVAIDSDADGFVEVVMIDTNADGAIDTYYVDMDDNNTLETIIIDDMQDGLQGNEQSEVLDAAQVVNMSDLEQDRFDSTAENSATEIPEDLPEIDNDADISGFA